MRFRAITIALAVLPALASFAAPAAAQEKPTWAFPVSDKEQPPVKPNTAPRSAPGSKRSFTRAQVDNMFEIADWFPEMYPALPKIVANGNAPNVRACGACHLPTGTGHDESAFVAGLPAAYFIKQVQDFKSGARKGSGSMLLIAQNITDAETRDAANYFASLKPKKWVRVVETDTVPKTYIGPGNKRLVHPAGGTEPIGSRIITVPEDEETVLYRDPSKGFVSYVPKGALAKGAALVAGGDGKTVNCTICHGPDLKGIADIPPLAGRTATHVVRQMFMMKSGERAGSQAALMKQVVANLTMDDMMNIAAYTASLDP
jgi:cytochrome c553